MNLSTLNVNPLKKKSKFTHLLEMSTSPFCATGTAMDPTTRVKTIKMFSFVAILSFFFGFFFDDLMNLN